MPGYLMYLLPETRLMLRTAALCGRDPRSRQPGAEMFAARGVHPNVEAAGAAVITIRETREPDRPTHRRSLRTWVHSLDLLLVFGGFLFPSAAKPPEQAWPDRIRSALGVLLAGAIWVAIPDPGQDITP
jgi:hypothetical protein